MHLSREIAQYFTINRILKVGLSFSPHTIGVLSNISEFRKKFNDVNKSIAII